MMAAAAVESNITLLALGQLLAEKAGRAHDHPYVLQMVDLLVIYRGRVISDRLRRNPHLQKYFLQTIYMSLEEVNKHECDIELSDKCDRLLRTTEVVPSPMRLGPSPFYFVGNETGEDAYSYTTNGYEKYAAYAPFGIGKKTRYNYRDKYIYIYNNLDLEYLRIEDVFDDPREISNFNCPNSKSCFDIEKDPFPIDTGTLQIVLQMITDNELRFLRPEEKEEEVKVDSNE